MGFDDSRSKVSISAVFPGASGAGENEGPKLEVRKEMAIE